MIDINTHPVWKGVSKFKKPAHLLRIKIARQYAKFIPKLKFIGVTGSVGKTSTVLACKSVLSEKYNTLTTLPSLDMIFNLPITILKTTPKVEKVVLEMGIEYPGEMDFYLGLVKPSVAIVTRISTQHSEFLGDIKNIASEKGKLVEARPEDGLAILNGDDSIVRKMAERTKAKTIFFGTDPRVNDVWASNVRIEKFQLVFGLNYGAESVEVTTKFLGLHSVYPLLAAAALGINFDIPLTKIKKALESVEPADHRLQALEGHNGSIILDDTYNAAPIAVEEAIDTLNRVTARRRIVILGEMKELGELSEKMHREVGQKIFREKPDLVLLGQGDANFIAKELLELGFIPQRLEYNLKNSEMVSKLLKILSKGDVVLIKGARSNRLDEVVKRISASKKG